MREVPLGLGTNEAQEITLNCEEVARDGFAAFAKLAWNQVEAQSLIWSWHMSEIAHHLEAVSRDDCRQLIINVPPGMSKSTLVSALWPAWDWLSHPSRRFMCGTFDASLALRDALKTRGLINSPWFQDRWGDLVQIDNSEDVQTSQSVYSTTAKGQRFSTTVGGRATGWHADIQIVDDPIKPRDVTGDMAVAAKALERAWSWYTQTMASRKTSKTFKRVIIMQRLHEADLVGRILESDKLKQWTHLMLPMKFEPERKSVTRFGGDIRTYPNELLVPERYDDIAVEQTRIDMGSVAFSSQYQQRPAPAAGAIFKRAWFMERWKALPASIQLSISVDCSFKDTAGADFVSMTVWGAYAGKFYLVDRIRDRMGLPETIACLKTLVKRHPRARAKLIEDKANGPAVEQSLRKSMTGIIMITPEGGKVARANACSPLCEAGNVVFPDGDTHPWADEMLEEVVSFPFAAHDDDVDTMTQYLNWASARNVGRYLEAMKNAKAIR